MSKFFFFSEKKYIILSISVILVSFIYSLNLHQYIYDGHHHGIMYQNAIDLLNFKKPFSEIYIQYGILTTIIHSLSLFVFGNYVYVLTFVTILFYCLTNFLIFLITKKLINEKYAFISVLLILANHPIPWLPWSNYIAFFFLVLSIFFFIKSERYSFFISGFFLGLCVLCRQDFFIPIFFSLFLYSIIFFFKKERKKNNLEIINIFIGFILPLFGFLIYIVVNNLYEDWVRYLLIPNLFLELHNTDYLELVIKFIKFFLYNSFINFINQPQYFLVSCILLINTIFLFLFIIKKKNILIFIALLSLTLSSVSINMELFRLYTSVSIGIITLLYVVSTSHKEIKRFSIFFLFLASIFSFLFYPTGNYHIFKKIIKSEPSITNKSSIFRFFKWEPHHVSTINSIVDLNKILSKNCNIEYVQNLTFDNFFIINLSLNKVNLIPHIKSDIKNSKLFTFFDKGFVSKINNLIAKENIILFITKNNDRYEEGNLVITNKYSSKIINLNKANDKPNTLRIYYPTKCNIKS